MDFSQQLTVIKESLRRTSSKESKVRFITSDKWRNVMLRALERLRKKQTYDGNMIDDLELIVGQIKQQRFVEAIINIEPFKPRFENRKKHYESCEESFTKPTRCRLAEDMNITIKASIIKMKLDIQEKLEHSMTEDRKKSLLQEVISYVTEEQTLGREFTAKYHPFRKIFQKYLFLLENKYKIILEAQEIVKIEEIQEKLILDLKLLQQFIVKSSQPYLSIFNSDSPQEKSLFQTKLIQFILQFVQKQPKINKVIRKIMRAAAKQNQVIRRLSQKLPDFTQINDYKIDEDCKIEGCYARSMSSLFQFSQATTSEISLQKLKDIRRQLAIDIDSYYLQKKSEKNIQISAYTQMEILKFMLVKLKPFLNEIFAQLRYLQVVYGQHDISFKYDDSSYMYAQLTVAIEQLGIDFS